MIDPGAHDAPALPRERTFGLFFAALAIAAAAWRWFAHGERTLPLALGALALALALLALVAPRVLAPLNRAWFALGMLLARVVNPIVLSLLFFVVVTPYALVLRLLRRDALRLRPDPDAASYWIERDPPGPAPDFLQRQY
jgi:hypothetical protein